MAVVRFSRRAEGDLLAIGNYTLRTWGRDQAILYLDELEACCQQLAKDPGLGRACEDIRPGLQRFEQGRHVVFYRQEASWFCEFCTSACCRMRHGLGDDG